MADKKKAERTPQTASAKEAKAAAKAAKAAAKEKKKQEKLIAYGRKLKAREAEWNARVSKYGNRRGRYKWAAPVGFVMTLLAAVGAIAICATVVSVWREASKAEPLREEIHYFLQPLTIRNPAPEFESITEADTDTDTLLRAAVWRITEAERIRILREKDENTVYAVDANGRLVIPIAEVEASWAYLYGDDAPLQHRTVVDENEDKLLEYSEANSCYYVPDNPVLATHQPVIDTITRSGSEYRVRVAYVAEHALEVDEHGDTIPPTADMADQALTQIFVLKRVKGHLIVTAIGSEG